MGVGSTSFVGGAGLAMRSNRLHELPLMSFDDRLCRGLNGGQQVELFGDVIVFLRPAILRDVAYEVPNVLDVLSLCRLG